MAARRMRFLLALVCALVLAAPLSAATFVVNSSADTAGSTCGASCTLRQAITAANATATLDTINFAIVTTPPRGDIFITPGSNLPPITQPLVINGYSQAGTRVNDSATVSNATLRICLQGSAGNRVGFDVCFANVVIRGFAITGFEEGINVRRPGCNNGSGGIVTGNLFGLRSDGTTAAPNQRSLILGLGAGIPLRVGGNAIAERNVFAGGAASTPASKATAAGGRRMPPAACSGTAAWRGCRRSVAMLPRMRCRCTSIRSAAG